MFEGNFVIFPRDGKEFPYVLESSLSFIGAIFEGFHIPDGFEEFAKKDGERALFGEFLREFIYRPGEARGGLLFGRGYFEPFPLPFLCEGDRIGIRSFRRIKPQNEAFFANSSRRLIDDSGERDRVPGIYNNAQV